MKATVEELTLRVDKLEVLVQALMEVTQTGTLDYRLGELNVLSGARLGASPKLIAQAERCFRPGAS
jgi:hypothetical protein